VSIRIIVVDDHPVTRTGTIAILQRDERLEVVGEADDGDHALALYQTLQPDLVILDVRLPTLSGIAVAHALSALPSPPHILMLSAFSDSASVQAALQAGAQGYVLKRIPGADLLRAVHRVMQGELVVLGVDEGAREGRVPLSPQEVVVLGYLAEGLATKEISQRLGLGARTVETYLTRIYHKLGVTNRAEALAVARREGALPAE